MAIDQLFAKNLTETCDIKNPRISSTAAKDSVTRWGTVSYPDVPCLLIDLRGALPVNWSVLPESTHLLLMNSEDADGNAYHVMQDARIVHEGSTYQVLAVIDPAARHHHLEISTRKVAL